MDLSFGSPEVSETIAKTIVSLPPRLLDAYQLTEITDGPFAGLTVEAATDRLAASQPYLAQAIRNASPTDAREILSAFGSVHADHAHDLELARGDASIHTSRQWSKTCAEQLGVLLKSMPSMDDALETKAWDGTVKTFHSDQCAILRAFVEDTVKLPGDHRNFGRQSRSEKLKRAFWALMLFGKIRSQRDGALALKMTVYLRALGAPTSINGVLSKFGMVISEKQYIKYVDAWIDRHYGESLDRIMRDRLRVLIVLDNINIWLNVVEHTGKKQSKMLNAVGGYVRAVPEPVDPNLSRVPPKPCLISHENLCTSEETLERVHTMLTRVFRNVLVGLKEEGVGEEQNWEHKGPLKAELLVSIPVIDENSGEFAGTWAALRKLQDTLKLTDDRIWTILGDHGTCNGVNVVGPTHASDKVNPLRFDTLPGLFHAEMAVALKLPWDLFRDEMSLCAREMGMKRSLGAPQTMFNSFSRVATFALASHSSAAWDVFTPDVNTEKSVETFATWVMDGLNKNENTKSAHYLRFVVFLGVAQAWKECCRHADGEGIVALMEFLLPFLATIHSTNYFPFLSSFICKIRSLSPYDRERTLQSLFINVRGVRGGAKACDLQMEYLVCALKRYLKNCPYPDAEMLKRTSQLLPLYDLVRHDIDEEFNPPRISTKHTISQHEQNIRQLRERMQAEFRSAQQHISDKDAKKKTAYPLFHVGESFPAKVSHMMQGHWNVAVEGLAAGNAPLSGLDPDNSINVLGDEDMDLDEYEQEFLCE